ncbi:hypothetical protein G7076_01990 [Sphingomonas sp. HDW15A]|uniref:hypothetical protein n=1 Tax=Sphingomonas sp. HDW15A TaxID=2714942 RepID=UPI00140871CE|nr:hypothetical protein [Sphingomonas sp. HDW15A]QIK95419.1 hypothetical protein G7076_01990 [Sphingomonas sp. HDW15A]
MMAAGGLIVLLAAAAQSPGDAETPPVTYPVIVGEGPTAESFVPDKWKLERKATGDLNGDRLPDAALVLHMADRANFISSDWDPNQKYDSNPRMLVVLFGRSGGGYTLAASDHALIPRLKNQNQDDPFDEVTIENGTLRVKMHLFMSAGGWEMGGSAFTFRWQGSAFKLIGFDRDSVRRNSGETEEVSINFLTGKMLAKRGNIGTEKETRLTAKIPIRPLIALGDIGDGLMFDPDGR